MPVVRCTRSRTSYYEKGAQRKANPQQPTTEAEETAANNADLLRSIYGESVYDEFTRVTLQHRLEKPKGI